MRLIALLSWYDEPAWVLTELVGSLAAADVDHIIAVDGAYALFPGARAQSSSEQSQAILAAAQGARMGVTLHCPRDVWIGNEIEKRSFMFDLAHTIGDPGDWFWVSDGDELVLEAIGLRAALERTERDVGEVMLDQISANGGTYGFPIRKLFRWQPSGIQVVGNHCTYMTDGQALWAPHGDLMPAEQLPFVRIGHRHDVRPPDRIRDRGRYYNARDAAAVET